MPHKSGTLKPTDNYTKCPIRLELHSKINTNADGQWSSRRAVPISPDEFLSLASLEGDGATRSNSTQHSAVTLPTAYLVCVSVSTTVVKTISNSLSGGRYHSAVLYFTHHLMQYHEFFVLSAQYICVLYYNQER